MDISHTVPTHALHVVLVSVLPAILAQQLSVMIASLDTQEMKLAVYVRPALLRIVIPARLTQEQSAMFV